MTRFSDIAVTVDRLTRFISDFTHDNGFSKVVVGLSGGVDSSLSAVLACRALGSENVLGLIMPYKSSADQSEQDALLIADKFGIGIEKIDITSMIDIYFTDSEVSALRRGNKLARERMSILFDIAARDARLVLGTSNKTEICLGYATWYGDAACSFNPLGGLYKNEIRQTSEYLEIPRQIIDKNPTADLWPGQTDEEELGISYELADKLLFQIVEQGERSLVELLKTGADEKRIETVVQRMNRFAFKRRLPTSDLLDGQPVPPKVELK